MQAKEVSHRTRGMADLPGLSESIRRLHALRWKDLINRCGFTGDHFKWHASRDRRHEAAKPAFSLAPPPLTPLRSGSSIGLVTFYGSQGEPLAYEDWHQREMAAWAARENDPAVIDLIGIAETIALANARFAGIVGDYLAVWAATNGDSDEFSRWLEGIAVLIACEVADLWEKGEWHVAWFERACRKKVEEGLAPVIEEWKSRASGLEILHLENPHLSLRSLLVAGGDLKLAFTFEQGEQAIDSTQRVLDSLRSADSANFSGDRPVQATEPATVTSVAGEQPSAAADRSGGSQAAGGPRSTATGGAPQPASVSRSSPARKREKPTGRYSAIDKMLTAISDAKPKNHDKVFRLLEERRVRIPHAEPFESCGGWRAGFRSDPQAARAWLSKRWSLLELPGFARGPKH